MIALGQHITKLYQTWREFHSGHYHSNYQYGLLADGRCAFRMRSDHTGQHRASMAWTRWKQCQQDVAVLLARGYEEVLV